MGYFSCNSKSAIVICDPHNWDLKKKKKKKSLSSSTKKTQKKKTPKIPKIKRFSYSDLESSTGGFSPQSFLGKGSHGSVYKAVLEEGNLIVAVKRTPPSSSSSSSQEEKNSNNVVTPVDNEIEILSKIRNPRLVNLLGFSLDSNENKLLVVEFMPNGSLYDLLHSNTRPPGWRKRIRYALQISKAIETLHTSKPPVIHRDIKSSNVLIDENWNARLGDFGLALRGYVEDVLIKCTPPAGTLGYLDPGYIEPENLSAKSDVFSFGILLLEIISGRNAIDVNYSPPSVIDWALPLIKQGEFIKLCDPRIGFPENLSVLNEISILAAQCVISIAEKRPSMSEVVNCLRITNERISSPIWNNFRRKIRKQYSSSSSSSLELVDLKQSIRNSPLNYRKLSIFEQSGRRDGDGLGRSNSVGMIEEIKVESEKLLPLVGVEKGLGLRKGTNVIRLNKSKSLGVLQSTKLLVDNGGERGLVFQLVKNPQIRVFDFSKLVISMDNNNIPEKKKKKKKKIIERKKSTKLISCNVVEEELH